MYVQYAAAAAPFFLSFFPRLRYGRYAKRQGEDRFYLR